MRLRNAAYGLLMGSFALGTGIALSQTSDAPKDNKGYTTSKTTMVELGPDFPGMEGCQLRFRVLKIDPGGHIGLHSHKQRPAVVYFLQGTDTVIRDDGTSQTFKAGDMTAEPGTTIHWHRNDGKDVVIIVTADIFKPTN